MRVNGLQAQFDAALAPVLLRATGPIGLAVSGGGDSMALLQLAAGSEHGLREHLRVYTVDHRLRPESADEALFVAKTCDALSVAHCVLTWPNPNVSQARARQARHRLLARALKEAGGSLLLTGHTIDDNVENFLLRTRAGSGWYGLAGMQALSASPVWPEGANTFIARPMLQMRREEIRRWLREQRSDWVDDPSNENPKYERVRVRQVLSGNLNLSCRIEALQQKFGTLRRLFDARMAKWLSSAKLKDEALVLAAPLPTDMNMLARGLSLACMAVSGTDRPTRAARSLAAAQRLQSTVSVGETLTLTLGGALVRVKQNAVHLRREVNRPNSGELSETLAHIEHICAGLTGELPS